MAAIALAPMPAAAAAMLTGASCTLAVEQYIRTMLRVALSIRARGLAQPVDRFTPALVVCLYPAMFGIATKMGLDDMNSSTDRQVCICRAFRAN